MSIEEKVKEFEKFIDKVKLGFRIGSQGLVKHDLNIIKRDSLPYLDEKYTQIYEEFLELFNKRNNSGNWSNYFPRFDD